MSILVALATQVLLTHIQPMCMFLPQVKPIGVMRMLDQGEQDDKVIAVHCDDPAFKNFNDISEFPAHRLAEIKSFFEDYKKNEHKVSIKFNSTMLRQGLCMLSTSSAIRRGS